MELGKNGLPKGMRSCRIGGSQWSIVNRAEELKFEKKDKALLIKSNKLATDIYNAYYGQYIGTMKSMPEGAFEDDDDMKVKQKTTCASIVLTLPESALQFHEYTTDLSNTARTKKFLKRFTAFELTNYDLKKRKNSIQI